MEEGSGSLTGLTPDEAKAFHGLYMTSFLGFTAIAVVAHILVWMWRPWLPPEGGWGVIEGLNTVLPAVAPMIS
jgi:light-harvesting complex 1 beta chain